jgi:hypothetical protein
MTTEEEKLWIKIESFELDDPNASMTFTERLSRENGWDLSFALRCTEEYKKFIFLTCIASHPLTPSDQVDQVWHLHLLYTESYWTDFCQHTLGRPIHHGPTKGGKQEQDKFTDWYAKTKALYQHKFHKEPPEDIWPPSKIRFGEINFLRINLDRHWIIKKIF